MMYHIWYKYKCTDIYDCDTWNGKILSGSKKEYVSQPTWFFVAIESKGWKRCKQMNLPDGSTRPSSSNSKFKREPLLRSSEFCANWWLHENEDYCRYETSCKYGEKIYDYENGGKDSFCIIYDTPCGKGLILFHSSRNGFSIMFIFEFDHLDWLSQFHREWRQTSKLVNFQDFC